jgi:GT2 family glycosyltransferase
MTRQASSPTISFVVPVRDDAERLRRCLASIARNDYPRDRIQVIVVDNGSEDDSAEIARASGAAVIFQPHGRVAQLRNRGVRESTGDLVAFVDADHEIDRDWANAAVSALASDDVAAAGSPYWPAPQSNWVQQCYDALRNHPASRTATEWLGSGNLVVRRAAFELAGGFDEALEACEDVDFCNRLRSAGGRILADPGLRSVHYGDPSTLGALFRGELWRGRNNLRVTLRGPWTIGAVRSALIPAVDLAALVIALGGLLARAWPTAAAAASVFVGLAAARAGQMGRRSGTRRIARAAQMLAVAIVYDLARALAPVARTGHRVRRPRVTHVATDSRS